LAAYVPRQGDPAIRLYWSAQPVPLTECRSCGKRQKNQTNRHTWNACGKHGNIGPRYRERTSRKLRGVQLLFIGRVESHVGFIELHDARMACAGENLIVKVVRSDSERQDLGVPLAVWQQYDLAEHSAFAQHLMRAASLFEWQPLRDQGLDLALFQQIQQR